MPFQFNHHQHKQQQFPLSLLILLPFYAFSIASKAIPRNRCELKLVADYEFFRVIGNGNYANAARYLINMIERVNGIFGPVEWGLDINGYRLVDIGFAIKEIKILDRPSRESSAHFNSIAQINEVDSRELLKSFSIEEGTNTTCLCLLITAKSFASGVLGLANIGDRTGPIDRGICAREPENGTLHLNTAVISVRRKQDLMITRVVDLVAAHEIGHAFGCSHDDVHDDECVPHNSRDGRYVMWESANTGYERNHYLFSPCSVRAVHRMLYSLAHRCFVEERRSLCGNGILEEGEQCDSGAQIRRGDQEDPCCTIDCRLKPHALCSPKHSECCSKNCVYLSAGRLCQARSDEACREESRCSGQSANCPEPKPLSDGTACTDEGKCSAGECMSFCRSLSVDLSPCLCEDAVNACRRCCRSKVTGQCAPVQPHRWLSEGSMCIHGQCNQRVCEKAKTDSTSFFRRLLNNFKGPAHRKFISDYIVFIVVFVTLLIWIPCGTFIVCTDEKRHKKLVEKRDAVEDNVQVVQARKRVTPMRSRTLNGNGIGTARQRHGGVPPTHLTRSANVLPALARDRFNSNNTAVSARQTLPNDAENGGIRALFQRRADGDAVTFFTGVHGNSQPLQIQPPQTVPSSKKD